MPPDLTLKLRTADVGAAIDDALATGRPYVLTRMADGDATLLAVAAGIPVTGVTQEAIYHYYGITPSGLWTQETMIEAIVDAIRKCDAFGIPWLEWWADNWNMRPMIIDAFAAWKLDLAAMPLTHHHVTRYLAIMGWMHPWFAKRLLILNEHADEVGERMAAGRYGPTVEKYEFPAANVIGAINVKPGQLMTSVAEALAYDFDIALVGVGVRKYPICAELGRQGGKVVLDMGFALNSLVGLDPKRPDRDGANPEPTFDRDWQEAERVVRERPDEI